MKKPTALLFTGPLRPADRRLDEKLLTALAGQFRLEGVLCPEDPVLRAYCRDRGITTWQLGDPALPPLVPDVALAWFADPAGTESSVQPVRGWLKVNVGPAWEAEALLAGLKKIHALLTGPGLTFAAAKIRLEKWDTPLSLRRRLGQKALGPSLSALRLLAQGKTRTQKGLSPDYPQRDRAALYQQARLDWTRHSHEQLHRRFQALRGEDLGLGLQAEVEGRLLEIQTFELHAARDLPGQPGEVLGSLEGRQVLRTLEGLCVLKDVYPFHRQPGAPEFFDHPNPNPAPAGKTAPDYPLSRLKKRLKI